MRIKNSLPVNSKLEEITTFIPPLILLCLPNWEGGTGVGGIRKSLLAREKKKRKKVNSLTWTRSYITPIECWCKKSKRKGTNSKRHLEISFSKSKTRESLQREWQHFYWYNSIKPGMWRSVCVCAAAGGG